MKPRSRIVVSASLISGSPCPSVSTTAALAGDASIGATSTKSRPPAVRIGAGVVINQNDSPSGRIVSVIIC